MDERTRLDRTAKARYRALTERLDRQVEQVAPGVWVTPSRSNPDNFHIVSQQRGQLVCDCEASRYGSPCAHVQAVQIWVGNAVYRQRVDKPQSPYPERKRVPLV